jgi:hypothetical protein
MNKHSHQILTLVIALVWLANGLYCKVLNGVPRHEAIVARILGEEHSRLLTLLIGISEICMAVWVLSRFRPVLNGVAQMAIVGAMNVIEFVFAPDLLLWGRFNALFAAIFICIVYLHTFHNHVEKPPLRR